MFDYTTKNGVLHAFEDDSGIFHIRLQNGEMVEVGNRGDFLGAIYDPDDVPAEVSDDRLCIMIEARKGDLAVDYFGKYPGDEAIMTDDELETYYYEDLCTWDWGYLKQQAIAYRHEAEGGDGMTGFTWVGSVYALCPSGKVYAAWTSNQTEWDVRRDEIWREMLEKVADEHGMWVTDGPEPDQVYLGCEVPEDVLEGDNDDADEDDG